MKLSLTNLRGLLGTATLASASLITLSASAPSMQAQAAPASLHGHINDAAGGAIKAGDLKLTTDRGGKDPKYAFTFPIDATGNYKGGGITPGDYYAIVVVDAKTVDFQPIVLKAGDDKTLDFDMTRAEYLKSLSTEARAAIEETKKKNAGATAYNVKIENINKTMIQARADAKNGKSADAIKTMQELTTQKPDEPLLWVTLGEVQLADADAAVKAARAAKTSPTDPAIVQKYTDTATSYQKGLDLNAAAKKPSTELAAAAYLNMGSALARSGKLKEAADAYDASAKANPANASQAYYNEAATFYNASKLDEAAAAADKAIAADPKKAEVYYIKAQALVPKATLDEKTKKFVTPPGCIEAYQEYLALAPDGPHAKEVTDLLTAFGQPVKNSYRAGKK